VHAVAAHLKWLVETLSGEAGWDPARVDTAADSFPYVDRGERGSCCSYPSAAAFLAGRVNAESELKLGNAAPPRSRSSLDGGRGCVRCGPARSRCSSLDRLAAGTGACGRDLGDGGSARRS